MTEFTKGEWAIDSGYRTMFLMTSDNGHICEVDCLTDNDGNAMPTEEQQANAHLLASAPDMYKLLESCVKTFAALYPAEIEHIQPDQYSEFKAVHHLIGSIQNELSKARGE